MKIGKKGGAWAWLIVLIAMFAIGLIYIVFTQVLVGTLFPSVESYLDTVTYANGTVYNVTDAKRTINYLKTAWNVWPIFVFVGLIIAGFVMAQRREPIGYRY